MERGVLLVAHGSSFSGWRKAVDQLVEEIHPNNPVEVGFIDGNGEDGIEKALLRLMFRGVEEALVIPLFVCSGSAHLTEIRRTLGFGEGATNQVKQLSFPGVGWIRLFWAEPLNDHPLIRELIKERIQELSKEPSDEVLMLVAHGSKSQRNQQEWETMVGRMASQLGKDFGFKGATFATIHPDNIRRRAMIIGRNHPLLVIPLFICEGYYTGKFIPNQLSGIPHRYEGRPYLPHPNGARWVEEMIKLYA